MISLEERLKRVAKLGEQFNDKAEEYARTIGEFETTLSKLPIDWPLFMKLGTKEFISWHDKEKVFHYVGADGIKYLLAQAPVKARQIAIQKFPAVLEEIETKFDYFLNKESKNDTSNQSQKTDVGSAKKADGKRVDSLPTDEAIRRPIPTSATKTPKRKKANGRRPNRVKEDPKIDGV